MKIDLSRVNRILELAAKEGRFSLLEPEVYQLLRAIGIQPPRYIFIKKGRKIGRRDLDKVKGDWVVLKIVSPLIAHKSDVGGVRIVKKGITGDQPGHARDDGSGSRKIPVLGTRTRPEPG